MAGGAAVWRPVVRHRGQCPCEAVFCGGRTVTAKTYGKGHSEGPEEGLPQHREEKEGQEGRGAPGEEEQSSDHRRGRCGCPAVQSGDRRQGVHRTGGPLRLRQVHHPAYDRRFGGYHLRRAVDRRQADERRGTQGSGHRHGVPELRPVPPHDRV